MTWVLGVNSPPLGWHDPSACLVDDDGRVVAFVEEERVSREKHGLHAYPRQAVQECLRLAGISAADIGVLAIGWDLPRAAARVDLDRLNPPLPGRPWQYDDTNNLVRVLLGSQSSSMVDVVFVPHHYAHAASAFYASGAKRAAVVVVDGNGDDEAVSIYEANWGRPLVRLERLPLPFSLGYMYDAVSRAIGLYFLEAGKTMGLSAYGRAGGREPWPMFAQQAERWEPPFPVKTNASHHEILEQWTTHFKSIGFKGAERGSEDLHLDAGSVQLAWSAQASLEAVMRQIVAHARLVVGADLVCVAGGVGVNCSANGQLPGPVYVPPVAGDAGVALGAAWSIRPPVERNGTLSPYLGSHTGQITVEWADKYGYQVEGFCADSVAVRLAAGEIGGLISGRAEIGPRALCHRSIIASPRSSGNRDKVNTLKRRELWRPLGPTIRGVDRGRFCTDAEFLHQYMVGATKVHEKWHSDLAGVTHVDGSARPQRLEKDAGHATAILDALEALGEPPVIVNTSFNDKGEPIVNTATEAVVTGARIGLDFMVVGEQCLIRTGH